MPGQTPRILLLIDHDPPLDPRVGWSARLCAEYGDVELLAAVPDDHPGGEGLDGRIRTRLLPRGRAAGPITNTLWRGARSLAGAAEGPPSTHRERVLAPPAEGLAARGRHLAQVGLRIAVTTFGTAQVVAILVRAGRRGERPDLIVAHDLVPLLAGVVLRRLHGCPLIYDDHEFWPYVDLTGSRLKEEVVAAIEGPLARRADTMVAVTPQIAEAYARMYGHPDVISMPNVGSRDDGPAELVLPAPSRPVRFVLQGRALPGRGIEELLDLWRELDDDRAVLGLRFPPNDYVTWLRERYADVVARGAVEFLDPVATEDLVAAAGAAAVGVIPYVGPNLNQRYCSPNKLHQYLLAGVAILAGDTEYVTGVVEGHDCGRVYAAGDVEGFRRAVDDLVGDPARLEAMRRRGFAAARGDYSWEALSGPYRASVERHLGLGS